MREHRVNTWGGFLRIIDEIKKEFGIYKFTLEDGTIFQKEVRILFRGQADANWPIYTTLERKTNREFNVLDYMGFVHSGVSEIESFTGIKWGIPEWPEIESIIKKNEKNFRPYLPCYDYLVYLRHHGFPSPLLDWTESPFIAAYFAYISAVNHPAVYCYIEMPKLGKGGLVGSPIITVQGPHVTTDKRHFSQKAWYTISTYWSNHEKNHVFCRHERIFERNDTHQDILIKITLPLLKRQEALRHLNDYNINHFTLFQSEDSLVKAIETKLFDLPLSPPVISK